MVLCACLGKPRARYETDVETAPPQMATHDLDAAKKAPDAPPALAGRTAGKMAVDQSSARDTHAEADRKSPVKALMASPKPAAEAPACIWEKLASHEIRMSPTPEPAGVTPEKPSEPLGDSMLGEPGRRTPDLTITGTSIKPVPQTTPAAGAAAAVLGAAASPAAAAGAKATPGKKPWGARSAPNSHGGSDAVTPPPRRSSSSGGASARKSAAGTSPSAGVPASLLKPTAASVARAQATSKPRSEEAVWKH